MCASDLDAAGTSDRASRHVSVTCWLASLFLVVGCSDDASRTPTGLIPAHADSAAATRASTELAALGTDLQAPPVDHDVRDAVHTPSEPPSGSLVPTDPSSLSKRDLVDLEARLQRDALERVAAVAREKRARGEFEVRPKGEKVVTSADSSGGMFGAVTSGSSRKGHVEVVRIGERTDPGLELVQRDLERVQRERRERP